ncbi:MAG: peroxiredoxin [Proteobacteria bacterium]|nr:peroxiredoxin [Pseudomonadota bacterium]
MTIKVGDKVPSGSLKEMGPDGPREVKTEDLFAGKTVAVFAVPGAFTPTCSAKHLPGFVQRADELRGKGVDEIVCLSVNDAFVMGAWGKDQKVGDKVRMMADGSADLTKKMGLELDLNPMGLGTRSRRYSMVVKNGKVATLNLEEGGAYAVSDADTMLGQL